MKSGDVEQKEEAEAEEEAGKRHENVCVCEGRSRLRRYFCALQNSRLMAD